VQIGHPDDMTLAIRNATIFVFGAGLFIGCGGSGSSRSDGSSSGTGGSQGVPDAGQPAKVELPRVKAIRIAASGGSNCAVTELGGIRCWGNNNLGQIGDGTMNNKRSTPVDVSGLGAIATDVLTGNTATFALTTSGGVKVWGSNKDGLFGNGTTAPQAGLMGPQDVPGLSSGITAVANTYLHACAITEQGLLKCWGLNNFGQLGDGTMVQRYSPVDVTGLTDTVKAVSVGGFYTCVLTSVGGVQCWGDNQWGQLGNGTTTQRSVPSDVTGLTSGVAAIASGDYHACALMVGSGVKCWGRNDDAQLGTGVTSRQENAPVDVAGLPGDLTGISATGANTCVLTSSGGIKCWGWNGRGELGDGTTSVHTSPVDVNGLTSGVTQVATGNETICALTITGGVKCWGRNDDGEIGDGTTIDRLEPADVIGFGP